MGWCNESQYDCFSRRIKGAVKVVRRKLPLTPCVIKTGLEALNKGNRDKINLDDLEVVGSVDIDACFRKSEPNAPRWDYYICIKRKSELYIEVHEVSEDEIQKILNKANWLREKIANLAWPSTTGRPLFIAPTKGISPHAAYGVLSKRLAMHKITVVMKGDRIADLLE